MILQTKLFSGVIPRQHLTYINEEASVLDASKLMRRSGKTELLVTAASDGRLLPIGIVTANDIVTRVIALDLDPAVMTIGDIAWSEQEDALTSRREIEGLRQTSKSNSEELGVLDGDGHCIGTVRRDEFIGIRPACDGAGNRPPFTEVSRPHI